jgi:hypothetical protein
MPSAASHDPSHPPAVIPAQAGIQCFLDPGLRRGDEVCGVLERATKGSGQGWLDSGQSVVIPAQAGI